MIRATHRSRLVVALLVATTWLARPADAQGLRLTVKQAVARALAHNLSLKVQRLDPALSQAPQQVASATFEPELFAEVSAGQSPGQVSTERTGLAPAANTNVGGKLGVRKAFSTGTSVELGLSSTLLVGGLDPAYQSSVTITARQSLLEGISRSTNELAIFSAKRSQEAARQQLGRKAEQVAAATLEAYFDLHAALAKDEVQRLAIQTAATTLKETRLLIAAGKVAASEQISARYGLQIAQRDKLKTAQAIDEARDRLARLIGLVAPDSPATPPIVTVATQPDLPAPQARERLRRRAFERRGDYLAALTEIAAQQANLAAAKHALLPTLDLVGSVFATGLSGGGGDGTSSAVSTSYGSSYKLDQVGWSLGLLFALPLGNAKASGERKVAELKLGRARAAAQLLQQSIVQQLNQAWRAMQLAKDQLELTTLAEQVAQSKLRSETLRYRAGKITAHVLAAVQAQATQEHLNRVQAVADLDKALVVLHATAGNLLPRLRL